MRIYGWNHVHDRQQTHFLPAPTRAGEGREGVIRYTIKLNWVAEKGEMAGRLGWLGWFMLGQVRLGQVQIRFRAKLR